VNAFNVERGRGLKTDPTIGGHKRENHGPDPKRSGALVAERPAYGVEDVLFSKTPTPDWNRLGLRKRKRREGIWGGLLLPPTSLEKKGNLEGHWSRILINEGAEPTRDTVAGSLEKGKSWLGKGGPRGTQGEQQIDA